MSTYEVWSLALSVISVVISLAVIYEVVVLVKQNRDAHEENRRLKTVEMMMEWSKSLQRETSFAETIVEGLNHEQSKRLYNKEPFEVDMKTKKHIFEICPEQAKLYAEEQKAESGMFVVEDMLLAQLRWYVVSYLNMLETVMTAWSLGIVDKETISQQYSYLYCEEKGWNVLEDFRKAAGEDAYPNIEEFIGELKNRNSKGSVSKKNILK